MKTKPKLIPTFGLLGSMLLPISGITAQSWNSADDFSAVNNPNGVWQYGYEATLGGPFTLFNWATTRGTGLDYWTSENFGNDPNVSHNPSMMPVTGPDNDFVLGPNRTAFHPGPGGELGIFRWTAPSSGLFSIHADFVGLGMSSTTDLHILIDGVPVFNGEINGPGTTTAFDSTQPLVAGSIVDFAVGFGSNGSYISDTTGIDAMIAAIPEPSSLALMGTGILILAGTIAVRRKRNLETDAA